MATSKKKRAAEEKQYRKAIDVDYENVATNAKVMTGKDAKKMSSGKVQKANREFDAMGDREKNRSRVLANKLKDKRI